MASGRKDAAGRRGVLRLFAAGFVAALASRVTRLLPGPARRQETPSGPPGHEARFWRRL